MITKVKLMAAPGSSDDDFEMPMLSPGEAGFFISHIDGLNPVPTNVNTKAFGGGDGEYFVGKTRGKRNIVLNFGFETRGKDVDAIRDDLYGHFYTEGDTLLTLRFEFDNKDPVEIQGVLETHEGDRFTQDLENQISIICPRPNFVAITAQSMSGVMGMNPDMVDLVTNGKRAVGIAVKITPIAGASYPIENLIFGRLVYQTAVEGSTPGVYITNHQLDILASGYDPPLADGEELWMDSRLGRKAVYIYNPSTGQVRNALKGMTTDSAWPILHPGTNKFRVYTPDSDVENNWEVFYYDEFGAI